MFSKKNKVTIGLLLLFCVIGGLVVWQINKSRGSEASTLTGYEDMKFAQSTDEVYKIFIAQRDGELTTLERNGDHWIYNGKYRANPNIMENLLRTIRGVRMQSIPTQASVQHIVKELATIGIKVELYDKDQQLLKTYYVGGSTNDERGTYYIMEGSGRPYVVELPEVTGSLRGRFTLKGDQWRDKSILLEDPKSIEFVSVEYPKQRDQSFVIQKQGDQFSIQPFYPLTSKINRKQKTGAVNSYLFGFESVVAEAFENDNPKRDSFLNLVPFSIVNVKNQKGEEHRLQFYPLMSGLENPASQSGSAVVERYVVDVDGQDFMLVQQRVCGKLFWAYPMFFE